LLGLLGDASGNLISEPGRLPSSADRLDKFVSKIRLRPCQGTEIEAALKEALFACADLVLNGDVLMLQRMAGAGRYVFSAWACAQRLR
jgi:hypothetical protein